jgi:carboxymethylenebutenolidase
MTSRITLTASDNHQLGAAIAGDLTSAIGGVVILQEIFGVNAHIRNVADRYAAMGFYAVAPALFDRVQPGIELDYDDAGKSAGIGFKKTIAAAALRDVSAAIAEAGKAGPVAVIGYCWGGSLAWRAACELPGLAAAVAYYGGELPGAATAQAACPVLAHFGSRDASIPMDNVAIFITAQSAADPAVTAYIYDADHGFNCDARPQYDAAAATQAQARTNAFLSPHLVQSHQ